MAPVTLVPAAAPCPRAQRRVETAALLDVVGAAVAAVCGTALLFGMYAPFSGFLAFVFVAFALFIVLLAVATWLRADGIAVANVVFTALATAAAAIVVIALVSIALSTLWRGKSALAHVNFFTQDMSKAGPLQPLTVGGSLHALVGTMWMIGIALLLTTPLGLVAATYLSETHSHFTRLVRTVVDAMTALPTILAGLFIYAFWILRLGFEKSGLAAALAVSIMMLPYMIRSADLVLRLVPGNLREASAALGAPRWRTAVHVVVPTARSGLATAVILAVARGIGEASPVILTAGYTPFLNTNPFHGPMVSLPLLMLKLIASGDPKLQARGFAVGAFLLVVVVLLFISARFVAGRQPGDVSPRARRRNSRASARDAARIARRTEGLRTS